MRNEIHEKSEMLSKINVLNFRRFLNVIEINWIVLFLISLIIFLSHSYNDILITTRQGINIWNNLFSGTLIDFYSLNNNIQSGNMYYTVPQGAAYDFALYLVFALWNFPLWIIESFFHVDVMNTPLCLVWSKMLLLLFLFISSWTLRQIGKVLGFKKETIYWMIFTFLSSAFIFTSIYIMSQYDIIGLSFTLLGFLAYLKCSIRKMIIWFAVAISFKLFALFIFVPLLLLYEKHIWRLFILLFSGLSLTLAQKLIFSILSNNSSLTSQNFFFDFLTKNNIPIGTNNTSLFFIFTIFLYYFCYFREKGNTNSNHRNAVYAGFIGFGNFFVFAFSYPYWIVLWLPFIILLIYQNLDRFRINLTFEIVMSSAMILVQMLKFDWVFGLNTIQPMLLPVIFKKVEDLKNGLQVQSFDALGTEFKDLVINGSLSVFVVSAILLAIYNRPGREPVSVTINETEIKSIKLRFALNSMIGLTPIILYLISVIFLD